MEKLRSEVVQLRERCEELQDTRTEAIKELLELKGRFQGELSAAQADLIDEASNREGMDRRLSELRAEVTFSYTNIYVSPYSVSFLKLLIHIFCSSKNFKRKTQLNGVNVSVWRPKKSLSSARTNSFAVNYVICKIEQKHVELAQYQVAMWTRNNSNRNCWIETRSWLT